MSVRAVECASLHFHTALAQILQALDKCQAQVKKAGCSHVISNSMLDVLEIELSIWTAVNWLGYFKGY